jgi:hypothetical protein
MKEERQIKSVDLLFCFKKWIHAALRIAASSTLSLLFHIFVDVQSSCDVWPSGLCSIQFPEQKEHYHEIKSSENFTLTLKEMCKTDI